MSEAEKVPAELPPGGMLPNLRAYEWQPSYSHEDGDLVELFFLPVLSCARLYQRVTGYFNQEALALASRGLDSLIRNGGRMELIVGCTLEQDEVDAIEKGYALRQYVAKNLNGRLTKILDDEFNRKQLGYLAWMIAHKYLDVKVAIPKDAEGKFRAGLGLYHAKSGMVEDGEGDRLVFRGSLNETHAGWRQNFESFDVSCDWRGEFDARRVEKTRDEFNALWQNKAQRAEVIEVPEAVKKELLQFLPAEPPPGVAEPPPHAVSEEEPGADEMTPVVVMDTPPVVETALVEPEREAQQPPVIEATVDEEPQTERPVSPVAPRRPRMSPEAALALWKAIREVPCGPGGPQWAIDSSMVNPWPHQLRAYRRMLDAWPFRLLIADEVGLGKTIEAGLIIRYLHISGKAKRILIMVPKAVIAQWQRELYEKFNLLVPVYTGKSLLWPQHHGADEPLERPVSRAAWTREPIVLVSSHLMRRRDRQAELIEAEDWDLIALDEAHHARRRGAGSVAEGGPNHLLTLMQKIKGKSPSLVLMTATPMQVAPIELYDLLALLGLPEEWTEEAFLEYFAALNKGVPETGALFRLTRLFQATERAFGELSEEDLRGIVGPGLTPVASSKLRKALREPKVQIPLRQLSDEQRQDLCRVLKAASPIRFLMSRHTRNLLREYAERGLLDSPIAERDVRDVAVTMKAGERALYRAVEAYIRETYQKAAEVSKAKKNAVGFVMTIYRRRVASSFYALRCTLNKNLEKLKGGTAVTEYEVVNEDVSDDEQVNDVMSDEDAIELEQEALTLIETDAIQAMLRGIAQLGVDSKALELVEQLKQAEAEGIEGAIVFTQYTDTMEFLKLFLAERLEGKRIGCYYGKEGQRRGAGGEWQACTREHMKAMLLRGDIDVLLCTDAAGEGLNLQRSGMLVNYDLPWNPMKVEQRIGRIDRIGQKHPVVRVVNLGYADTVEVDVYFALSERIGLFQGLVGKLQPILSRLPQAFASTIEDDTLTPEQMRQAAVDRALRMVDEVDESGFDIDAVSEADLTPPYFAHSPVTPADVEQLLKTGDPLPGGGKVRPLDEGTFSVSLGDQDGDCAYRVTPRPETFDLHFESHQLFLHGSPLFKVVTTSTQE